MKTLEDFGGLYHFMTLSTLLLPGKVRLLVSASGVQFEQGFPVYKDCSYIHMHIYIYTMD